MKIRSYITKNILWIIYYIRNEKVKIYIKELKKLENINIEQLKKYKENKYKELIDYAMLNYPIITNLSSNQKKVLTAIDDNTSLPLITKKLLKRNMDKFVNPNIKLSWRSTSGTTGHPLIFPKDRTASGYMDAMMHDAYSWHGINIGDKQARIWGKPIKLTDRILQIIKDIILNRKRLSAFEMNENSCVKFYNYLIKNKAKYFYAYSNALYQFALFLEKMNLNGKSLNISVAICTGEVLFEYQRIKIENYFGCKVINEYGTTENGIIGFECEYGKMHVMPTAHVNILNPDDQGMGEIVITELNSKCIPFIRYNIGDIGKISIEKCKCMRSYEILEVKEGRVDDYIKCPDGRIVYDAILAYVLKDYASQFKVYQDNINELKIYIVPSDVLTNKDQADIEMTLRKYIGNDIKINTIIVEDIPCEKSGKFRYFETNVT